MRTQSDQAPVARVRLILRTILHWHFLLALLLVPNTQHARAQSLAVQPVTLILLPGQKIATLTLKNPATEPMTIQLRSYVWSQQGNNDPLTATEAVLISPPMATIPPGSSQVIRVALRQPSTGQEATYRLLVDQLPPPAKPKEISVLLRLSIPIFSETTAKPVSKLEFHVEHQQDGHSFLVVSNNGQCHDSIRNIRLKSTDGSAWKAAVPGLPYVLVGAERRWPILPDGPSHDLPKTFSLSAQSDFGAVERQVSVTEAP